MKKYINILIVDDHSINIKIINTMLKSKNILFESADSGLEAIKKFKSSNFDIIIMDIHMPILNGIKTVKVMRSYEEGNKSNKIPIIAMTSEDEGDLISMGFDKVLKKPFNRTELLNVLDEYLSSIVINSDEKINIPTSLPGLDLKRGLNLLEQDYSMYIKVLKSFLEVSDDIINDIKEELEKNNLKNLMNLLHTLKGLSGNIGGFEVKEISSFLCLEMKRGCITADAFLDLYSSYDILKESINIIIKHTIIKEDDINFNEKNFNLDFKELIDTINFKVEKNIFISYKDINLLKVCSKGLFYQENDEYRRYAELISCLEELEYEKALNILNSIKFNINSFKGELLKIGGL